MIAAGDRVRRLRFDQVGTVQSIETGDRDHGYLPFAWIVWDDEGVPARYSLDMDGNALAGIFELLSVVDRLAELA